MCIDKKSVIKKSLYHDKLPHEIGTDPNFKMEIFWPNVIGFLILHIGMFYGLYLCLYAKFASFLYAFIFGFISAEGVTIGAHRLYTHRSFKARLPLRLLLVALQTIAGQNCMFIWVRDHRLHHKYSDTDADPHNANRGFFFCHMGWLMAKKHPAVIEKGRTIDLSDLEKDPIVMFQKRHYKKLYFLLGFILPIAIPYFCWNETLWNSLWIGYFFRYVMVLNATWTVNSIAHLYGTRPYDSDIKPVESIFVGIISFGEGWHNYHHAYPWDYRAAEYGVRYSVTTWLIDFFERIGWAYDLRGTKEEIIRKRALRIGDGTHPIYQSEPIENKEKLKNYGTSLDEIRWRILMRNG